MYKARLKKHYEDEILPSLKGNLGCNNIMAVPKLEKVVVNITSKDLVANPKLINSLYKDLFEITGQMPVITKAKSSIASFKLREGMPIGVKVTLRGNRMYDFLDVLINIALPNSKDFKKFSPKQFDSRGNFSMSLKEQTLFPSIDYDKIDKIRGLDIVVVTSAKTDKEGKALLELLNFPFRD